MLVEVLDRLGLFHLHHDPGAAGGDALGLGDVLGALHEGQADVFDAERQDEVEVGAVLGGQGRDRQGDVGDVDALAVGQRAADDDFGLEVVGAGAGDAQAELAVVEQQGGADLGGGDDFLVRQVDAADVARGGVEVEPEGLAGLQLHAAGLELADAQLGALDVGEDADGAADAAFDLADHADARGVVFVGAVGEVEAEDVGAGAVEAFDDLDGGGGGAERRDHLGAAAAAQGGAGAMRAYPSGFGAGGSVRSGRRMRVSTPRMRATSPTRSSGTRAIARRRRWRCRARWRCG